MAQQTAVEWLVEQYANENYSIEVYEQAKQMERKQIIQSFRIGKQNGYESGVTENFKNITAEEYYNETYGKELHH